MMCRLVAVVAVVLCAAVAGCAASTQPASDLTASSARLNAEGRTDSTPAHYYFQYSTAASALGTGFGLQTPTRGPVPAGTSGPGGKLLPFSEPVSGLKPNTTYYFRICGGDGQTSQDVCAQTQSFSTPDGVVFNKPGTYSWTVPTGVTRAEFDVSGANGGSGAASEDLSVVGAGGPGALGAHVRAIRAVRSGETLTVVVGGRGGVSTSSTGGAGGSDGGGRGGNGALSGGGGGGGASDVRTGPGDASGLSSRLLVAGGGGGGASVWDNHQQPPPVGVAGGSGGLIGASGKDGSCFSNFGPCTTPKGGGGGTAVAGGAGGTGDNGDGGAGVLGSGGAGGTDTNGGPRSIGTGGGGGGGGYYGGGGGSAAFSTESPSGNNIQQAAGGGGGSSLITSTALCSSPVDTGVQTGDGTVTISYNPPAR